MTVTRRIFNVFRWGFLKHRGQCVKLMLVGFLGTVVQAAALLSLIPVIRNIDGSRSTSAWTVSVNDLNAGQYALYVAGLALLFTVAVRMKYRVFSMAYGLSGRFAVDCAEQAFRSMQAHLRLADRPRAAVLGMVNRCLFRMTMACSVLFRQVMLALNDAFLLVVFLLVLFYLSPAATLVMTVLAAPLLVLYLRSYKTISARADKVEHDRSRSRNEIRGLVDALRDRATTPDDVGRRIRGLFDGGYAGEALFGQMALRTEMKGSSAVVELITPVSVVVIAVLVFFSKNLGMELATILIYYIVLRQTIGASNQIADSMVMINRVYPDLRDYVQIASHDTAFLETWLDSFDRSGGNAIAPEGG